MSASAPKSPWFLYTATLAVALIVIGISLVVIANASFALMQPAQRDRTFLDQQIETAREIRAALAKPVAVSEPLPPITARPLHDTAATVAEQAKLRRRAPAAAAAPGMDAMAMDTSGPQPSATYYPVPDRFAPQ